MVNFFGLCFLHNIYNNVMKDEKTMDRPYKCTTKKKSKWIDEFKKEY